MHRAGRALSISIEHADITCDSTAAACIVLQWCVLCINVANESNACKAWRVALFVFLSLFAETDVVAACGGILRRLEIIETHTKFTEDRIT